MSTFRQKVQAKTQWVKPAPEDIGDSPRPAPRSRRSSRPRGAAEQSVTAHRLFPAFAALWFAALFGLGSLAISSAALGSLVTAIGLPALVPATRPPLGFTAHILVAFALTFVGAALGLALGLRLRPKAHTQAVPDEAAPDPVPVAQTEVEEAYKVRARDAHPDAPPRRPLVLTEAFADSDDRGMADAAAPAPILLDDVSSPLTQDLAQGGSSSFLPLDLSALDLGDIDGQPDEADLPMADTVSDGEAGSQAGAVPLADVSTQAVPPMIAATPQLSPDLAAALPAMADGAWSPVAGASLESLGLVQLIERLALAIAARKAADEAAAKAASGEPIPAMDPARPVFAPGPFSHPASAPPLAASGEPAETPDVSSAREAILRRLGAIAAGDEEASPQQASFPRPVRLATAAPAPAAAPFETDDALRAALATLQRMTARG